MLVKRLSKKRQAQILSQIDIARTAMEAGDLGSTMYALDKAMKIANGRDNSDGSMRYDELDDACDAFLRQSEFLSLSSCLTYIKYWREEAKRGDSANT